MKTSVQRRNGFTLIEMTIATSLTVILAMMLSTSWVMLTRPMSSLIAWGQLFQEMDIAVTTMARDLGGAQFDYVNTDNPSGDEWLGEKRQGLLIACRLDNDLDGDHLQLCFEGDEPDDPPTWDLNASTNGTVIDYYIIDDTLIRKKTHKTTSSIFYVASNVVDMTVVDENPSDPDATLRITLTFQYPKYYPKDKTVPLNRTCILITKKNP